MALNEKSTAFNIRQISSINTILENHTKSSHVGVGILEVEASKLEDSVFNLVLTQMKFDLQSFKVYQSKLQNYFSAVQHIKLDWRKKAFDTNRQVFVYRGLWCNTVD